MMIRMRRMRFVLSVSAILLVVPFLLDGTLAHPPLPGGGTIGPNQVDSNPLPPFDNNYGPSATTPPEILALPPLVRAEVERCGLVVDTHLHIAGWLPTAEPLLNEMTNAGISQGIVYSVYYSSAPPMHGIDPNTMVATYIEQGEGRLSGLASLNTTGNWNETRDAELSNLASFLNTSGFVGAKIAPPHTCLPLQSEIIREIVATVSSSPQPRLAIHTGTTPYCGPFGEAIMGKRGCCSPEYVDPNLLVPLIQEFSNVTFIFLHAGFDFLDPTTFPQEYYNGTFFNASMEISQSNANVILELSAVDEDGPDENQTATTTTNAYRAVLQAGLADRVVYGSDKNAFPGGLLPFLNLTVQALIDGGYNETQRCNVLVENPRSTYNLPLPPPPPPPPIPPVVQEELDRCGLVIDTHLHIADWFETAEPMLQLMNDSGVDKGIMYSVYSTVEPIHGVDPNIIVSMLISDSKGRLSGLASLNTTGNWNDTRDVELNRLENFLATPGFVGAKLAPPHTCLRLDSEELGEILGVVAASSQPVLGIHIGTTPFCGALGEFISLSACCQREYVDPNVLLPYVEEYDNVTFVFLHSGFDFVDPIGYPDIFYNGTLVTASIEVAKTNPNVFLEISAILKSGAGTPETAVEAYKTMKEEGLVDRMVYGSDQNFQPGDMLPYLTKTVDALIAAGFNEAERCSVLVDNAYAAYPGLPDDRPTPTPTTAVPTAAPAPPGLEPLASLATRRHLAANVGVICSSLLVVLVSAFILL